MVITNCITYGSKSVGAGLSYGFVCMPALSVTQQRRCGCRLRLWCYL